MTGVISSLPGSGISLEATAPGDYTALGRRRFKKSFTRKRPPLFFSSFKKKDPPRDKSRELFRALVRLYSETRISSLGRLNLFPANISLGWRRWRRRDYIVLRVFRLALAAHVLARTRFVTSCGVSLPVVEDKNPPDVRRYGRS